jgi:threonine dehydrogenase-like Zn-dependent dehydrogenase
VVHGPRDLRVEDVPDAALKDSTDAVLRVVLACICGSDLWVYRGLAQRDPGSRIGHEFLGTVEDVGSDVSSVRPGDLVLAPFVWSDGTCPFCRSGLQTSCLRGGFWGSKGSDGGQGEAVRVPFADGTLVPLPSGLGPARLPAVLTLSDVFPTGHHAGAAAGVGPGSTVAVIGDGAVGLCAVLAAARVGAERIIALGRHEDRIAIARRFGATDVVPERGEEAVRRILDLTDGLGVPHVLECVGTEQSWETALGIARPGGMIGWVGAPYGASALPLRPLFDNNVGVRGGVAPARAYIPEMLGDVLAGTVDPSPVFDLELELDRTPEGYAAMDERRALKVLIRP